MDDRYAAGLFDGEGYVRINRWKRPNHKQIRYQIIGGIGMTHRPIIEELHKTYGGSINMNRHDLRNPKNRIQFTWHVASHQLASFLRRVYPYLVVKKDEAKIALDFQEHVDTTPYSPKGQKRGELRANSDTINALRQRMHDDILALKKRRYQPFNSGPK